MKTKPRCRGCLLPIFTAFALAACAAVADAPKLKKISLSPSSATIVTGRSQQFTVIGHYDDDSTRDLTAVATYSSSRSQTVVVDARGLATGITQGEVEIEASYQGEDDDSELKVIGEPKLQRISITPSSATIAVGGVQPFAVTGTFSDGSTVDLTAVALYSSSEQDVALAQIDGSAVGVNDGEAEIEAEFMGKKDEAELTVRDNPRLERVTLTPEDATIAVGEMQIFTLTAHYENGQTVDVTQLGRYESDHQKIAVVSPAGVGFGVGPGETEIEGFFHGKKGKAELNVIGPRPPNDHTVDYLFIRPTTATILTGSNQAFKVFAVFKNGSTQDVTTVTRYSSDDQEVALVGIDGVATGISEGDTEIEVSFMGKKAEANLTVLGPPELVSISISPSEAVVFARRTIQFTVTALFDDGSSKDITDAAFYSSSRQEVVLAGTNGVATGVSVGTARIRAEYLDEEDESTVTVPVGVFIDGLAIDEGNTGTTSAVVSVALYPPTDKQVIVRYATADGTAMLADADYSPTNGLLVFAPGQTNKTITVRINGDLKLEGDETFSITLSHATNAVIGAALGVVTIRNDDVQASGLAITSLPNLITINSNNVTVRGTFNVSNPFIQVNGVDAQTSNGTFLATILLHEGNNNVTVVATDDQGRVTSSTIQVTVDTTPPRLTIDSPRDGAVISEPRATVTGVINDAVVGTVNGDQATVLVNGLPATVANRTYVAMDVPLVPGTNTITALGTDQTGNTNGVSVKVFYNTAIAARIKVLSGDGQSGPISSLLPQPLVVLAMDTNGNPCANKKVIFKVTQNDGLVTGPTNTARSLIVMSGPDGQAQVQFALGTRAGAGNNQVSASIVGFEGEAMFCASATPSTPGLLALDAGNNQVGVTNQPLPRAFAVIVVDSGNNRLPNIPITFTVTEGGGSFGGPTNITVNSDSDGRALTVLTLGPEPGNDNNRVTANFSGNTGSPAFFVASGQATGDPAETSVSGVVLDNSDVPVPGAIMRIVGFPNATRSDSNGFFQIKPAPVGAIRLIADGSTVTRPGTWVWLQFDLVTIAGQDNGIGMPVRLLPIDTAQGIFVDTNRGGILTLAQAPGYSLTIASNSVTFPDGSKSGLVSVTVVHPDKMPDPPSFGQQPRFLVSIQPANAAFNPPAAMCIPNLDGLPPGQKTDMYSYDHDMGRFVSIGTGTISEDGTMLCSDPGSGVVKAGWHCGGNPANVAAGIVSQVSVDKNKLEAFKGDVTATGSPTPPHDSGPFEWKKDFTGIAAADRGDVDFTTSDSGNQSKATIVGTKPGKVILKVRYRCKSAQWSAYKDVAITVPKVQFAEDGTSYGFDNYNTRKDFPAKSVEEGKTDTVKGVVNPAAGYQGLQYISSDEGKVKIAPKDATSGNEVLTVTGVALGEALIEAKVDTTTHAKMTAKTYKKVTKTVAITLIHEKASGTNDAGYLSTDISDADITAAMKLVYKQAVIEWTIVRKTAKTVEFDLDNDGKINVAANAWMNTEMAAIRDAAMTAEDYNIFLVNNPSDGSSGFMQFNQKYGYIHPDHGNARTIPHELGHGQGLQHTTPDVENIMYDFTSTTKFRLRKEQWDALNP